MSAATPYADRGRPPAVLLHGTNDTSATLRPLVDALRRDGRDATTLDYGWHRHGLRGRFGQGGLAPLAESTREVVAAAAAILARPHTPYVDLVGHSQGGLHALACAAALPDRVAHVVLLGSPLWGVTPLGRSSRVAHSAGLRHALDWALGPSARGMVAGSGRLPDLTALPSGPRYLLVASRDDRLVRPAYLAGDIDPRLRVVWVQDLEPGRKVSHPMLVSDPVVTDLVRAELDTWP
ncbi:MAG: alpha/beta fold hydrolase [Austwickia sp.]|nr:MAG: alpha/beta fold hydrolase [Austwickia sp.]